MKHKILIIEDEPSLRQVLETSLKDEGFVVVTASNGEEGLTKALIEKPDLILLDLILPKMDGFAVLDRLSTNEKSKDIKVIVLTNLSYSGRIGELIEKGAKDYLVKADWTIEELMEKVKNRLKD